jgi:hypothetical protein
MADIIGITPEEAEALSKSIPRVRFSVSIQTSGSSGFGGATPLPIESVMEYAKKYPLRPAGGGNGMVIFPIFVSEMDK